jgi:hypothetical protein
MPQVRRAGNPLALVAILNNAGVPSVARIILLG